MQMLPKSRAGAVKPGTVLMIVSFMAMGGFLYWLSLYEPPETDMAEEDVADESGLNEVAFADFVMGTQSYLGEEITLRLVEVESTVGDRLFWTMLPGSNPYLMHVADDALADSVELLGGIRVDITGSVMALSDSVLDVWMEAGVLRSEGDRLQTMFAVDKGDYFRILRFEMEGEDESGDGSGESG